MARGAPQWLSGLRDAAALSSPSRWRRTLLLWPALWNGYPLVFSDTGTYLAQAIEHYAGWDRPIFYSLFLLPLHMTLTTWPAIAAQALLIAHVLHIVRRTLLPQASVWWLVPLAGAMSVASSLPWIASQLSPDVFTGVLVLVLALLIFVPDRLYLGERIWLVAFAAFMIAAHLSHVLLALLLLVVLLPFRFRCTTVVRSIAPLALAGIALISVNLLAFGRASLAPFGNIFLLTRVIYDGPGMDVLRHDCPSSGWRLCAFIDRMPAIEDDFLWRQNGPVVQAGGAKLVSSEALDTTRTFGQQCQRFQYIMEVKKLVIDHIFSHSNLAANPPRTRRCPAATGTHPIAS